VCLAALLIVFSVSLASVALAALLEGSAVAPALSRLWSGPSAADRLLAAALQDLFGCCGWNLTRPRCQAQSSRPCASVIGPALDRSWGPACCAVLGITGAAALLATLGAIAACSETRGAEPHSLETVSYTDTVLGPP
jgi:hypothetical protein